MAKLPAKKQSGAAFGSERITNNEAKESLQETYGFTEFEIDVVANVDSKLAPNLAILLRYRASKFETDDERKEFLKTWQMALPEMWEETDSMYFTEEVGSTGTLKMASLFNAYQPRSSRHESANRALSLVDLEPEELVDPYEVEFVKTVQDVVKFLYIRESEDSQNPPIEERRRLFRDRINEWRSSGKSLAEFVRDFSQEFPGTSYRDLPVYTAPENRSVIEDVVLSTYIPAIAKSILSNDSPGFAPETIALQKNTSDMIKNRFPELSLLLIELHKEELIRLGTGSATHTLAPMFPGELKTQYSFALANHLLSLGIHTEDFSSEGGDSVVVPLHIPEDATTPKLWEVLQDIQDEYNVRYITAVDSKYHVVPSGDVNSSGLNRIKVGEDDSENGIFFAVRDNPFSMQFAFPQNVDLTLHDSREELPIDKYCINGLEALLRNGFSPGNSSLELLSDRKNAVLLRQTDFEEVGHHQRAAPMAAWRLEGLYQKFGVSQATLEEIITQNEVREVKLGSDIRENASWGAQDEWAFFTWMNPNNEWVYGEAKVILLLTKEKINRDIQKIFGNETTLEDLPMLMYRELVDYSSYEINSMSSYDMLKKTAEKVADSAGTELSENDIRNLFVKVSYYEDLMSSCPYWWSPQEVIPEHEKVDRYVNQTPTVNQARMAALRLADYSIRYADTIGDFRELADYFFDDARFGFVLASGNQEEAVKVSTEMRNLAAQRIHTWLEKRKDTDEIRREQYEYWSSIIR